MHNIETPHTTNRLPHLDQMLWAILNNLRASMDISATKELFSGIFLFKYLSDNFKDTDRDGNEDNLYRVPSDCTFEYVVENHAGSIYEKLNHAFEKLELLNGEKLTGIFTSMDFKSEHIFGDINTSNKLLSKVLNNFLPINLKVTPNSPQALIAESFQYALDRFSEYEGKMTGEWSTPPSIRSLVSNIFTPDLILSNKITVYDPVCGSAGLLLELARNFKKTNGEIELGLFGQEKNLRSLLLAKTNIIINGYDDSNIKYGDTILEPKHIEDGALKQFDIVIGNPPFSLNNWGIENIQPDPYKRFIWGIPPKSKADYAFILHMLASSKENGKVAVIVPHGVLFREGSEGLIRKKIIEANYLDAVIILPPNLFQSTSIPVSILVLDKGRKAKDKSVIFIDASNQFIYEKRQNILSNEHIKLISDTYKRFKLKSGAVASEKISRVVTQEEIIENDYNLNISRYLTSQENFRPIDIDQLKAEIIALERQEESLDKKIGKLSNELFEK